MDKRTEKTQAAILTACFELLAEKGKRVTVSEIARRANIDRKTFYLHYVCVEDIIRDYCQKCLNELNVQLRGCGKPITIGLVFEGLTKLIAENAGLITVISTQKENEVFFSELKNTCVRAIIESLHEDLHLTELQIKVYTELYVAGIVSVYKEWLMKKLPVTSEELAAMIAQVSVYGLESVTQ